MAKPVTQEVDSSIGVEKAIEMASRQNDIRDSQEQRQRQARREAILSAREAHKQLFETVFSLDPGARAKSSTDPSIIFWTRFHRFNEHGTIDEKLKLDPDNAATNIGIIGATIAINRDPSLRLGVDIQTEDLEHRLIVGAAIKELKSVSMDVEDTDWHTLNGLYVPSAHDKTLADFEKDLYETVEHHGDLVIATESIGLDSQGSPVSDMPNVHDAIAVINALSVATTDRLAAQHPSSPTT